MERVEGGSHRRGERISHPTRKMKEMKGTVGALENEVQKSKRYALENMRYENREGSIEFRSTEAEAQSYQAP